MPCDTWEVSEVVVVEEALVKLEDAVSEALHAATAAVTSWPCVLVVPVVVVVPVVLVVPVALAVLVVVLEEVTTVPEPEVVELLLVDTAAVRWLPAGVCATTAATPAPPAARVATAIPAAALVETSARSLVGSNMDGNLMW
jgi:hypothetical protein